jgi:SAM-dependent methyltransferase
MSTPPLLFDRALRRRRLDRSAQSFAGADFLHRRAAEDAGDRLAAILRRFPVAVELGAAPGLMPPLVRPEQVDLWVQAGLSRQRLAASDGPRVVVDEERLPFAEASLDLVVSLLSLHWTNDLVGALVQVRRALRPDGLFIGTMLGGATLTELRQSLLIAESEIGRGAGARVSPFADGFDGAGLLQRAGFALPVADVDRITVRYDHPIKLMADLRAMGETSALIDRPREPLTRAVLTRTAEVYAERFALPDGRIPATFEIVTLTGWAAHDSQQKPLKPGSAKMRLADAIGGVEHRLQRDRDD